MSKISNAYKESHPEEYLKQTKIYEYETFGGRTRRIKRTYYTQNKDHIKQNRRTDLINYASDTKNTENKTYKEICQDFNKLYHSNYSLSAVYKIIAACNPKKRVDKMKKNQQLVDFLKNEENVTDKRFSDILKTYNKQYDTDISITKLINYYKIVYPESYQTDQNETDISKSISILD